MVDVVESFFQIDENHTIYKASGSTLDDGISEASFSPTLEKCRFSSSAISEDSVIVCSLTSGGRNLTTTLLLRKSQNLLFLAPEVQWASKFAVFVRLTFPLNVSSHAHIWYVR